METGMRITEEAADWLIRLEEDDGAECRTAFFAWLQQSAWHVREFLQVTEAARQMEGMDSRGTIDVHGLLASIDGNVVTLKDKQMSAGSQPSFKGRWKNAAWAAAMGALALGISWLLFKPLPAHDYSTGVGEQRSFKLSDGSVLHLNARSRVDIEFSKQARELRLLEGEALFVVEKDVARPFRVTAGTATIQALGTQFNVYRRGADVTVSVLEGAVRISSKDLPLRLDAGEEARIVPRGAMTKRPAPDVTKAIAWRQRKLVFRDNSLAEVAEQFNRYNSLQIQVEGAAARDKQLIGVFNADDTASLLLFLQKDPSLEVERQGDRLVIKSR